MNLSKDFAEIFERICVINLDNRPDRLREAEAQLARVGLSIDGARVRRFPAVRPASTEGWPSIGALGCFMSHLGALRAARDDGVTSLGIIEDDFDFSDRFLAEPRPYLDALADPGWRAFHCGEADAGDRGPVRAVSPPPEQALRCTHFVAFRGEAIPRAVDYLERIAARPPGDPEGGPMHVDGAYSWFRRASPDLPTLSFAPAMGVQRPSASDITPGRLDRLPFLRGGVALARRLLRAR